MEPLTLVIVLVTVNCATWDPYSVYDEVNVGYSYLVEEYNAEMNGWLIYCVENSELSMDGFRAKDNLRSWADSPNSIVVYLFDNESQEPYLSNYNITIKDGDRLLEFGTGYSGLYYPDATMIFGYGDPHDYIGCENDGREHICEIHKIQLIFYERVDWDVDWNVEWNVFALTHELSHAILHHMGYPEAIRSNWVHDVAHLNPIMIFVNNNEYRVPATYDVASYPALEDGSFIWTNGKNK